jgi:phosphoribosylformimino-5-aminoimidazole carboxamide ribotide isomerase
LSADARDGMIATKGWTQTSSVALNDHIEMYLKAGIQRMVVTDIGRDGMLEGPSVDLYQTLVQSFGERDYNSSQAVGFRG